MADLTVAGLLDRVHAINGRVTLASGSLTTFRYWPRRFDVAALPFIVPLLQDGRHSRVTSGNPFVQTTRQIKLLCPVDSPNNGLLTETAQRNSEALIDPLIRAYRLAPYLEDANGAKLAGVMDVVELTTDTGITLSPLTGLLHVEFTLVVPVIAYQSS